MSQLGPEPSVAPIAWRKLLEQRKRSRRPLGRGRGRLLGPPEHTPWVEAKSLPEETHFRREGVTVQLKNYSQGPKSQFLSQLCSSWQIPLALGLSFL